MLSARYNPVYYSLWMSSYSVWPPRAKACVKPCRGVVCDSMDIMKDVIHTKISKLFVLVKTSGRAQYTKDITCVECIPPNYRSRSWYNLMIYEIRQQAATAIHKQLVECLQAEINLVMYFVLLRLLFVKNYILSLCAAKTILVCK